MMKSIYQNNNNMNEEIINEYAGADGWAAMHRNEWKDDRLPFINFRKL